MLQVVLQSVPAEQAQLFSGLQVQPAPVQVAGPSPASLVEQAIPARRARRARNVRVDFMTGELRPLVIAGYGGPDRPARSLVTSAVEVAGCPPSRTPEVK